jgi:hypothetical protein
MPTMNSFWDPRLFPMPANHHTHKFPNVKRDERGCWHIELGNTWVPCGSWDRVLIVFGGHA